MFFFCVVFFSLLSGRPSFTPSLALSVSVASHKHHWWFDEADDGWWLACVLGWGLCQRERMWRRNKYLDVCVCACAHFSAHMPVYKCVLQCRCVEELYNYRASEREPRTNPHQLKEVSESESDAQSLRAPAGINIRRRWKVKKWPETLRAWRRHGGRQLIGRQFDGMSGLTLASVNAGPMRRESLCARPRGVKSPSHSKSSDTQKPVPSCCVTPFVSCLSMHLVCVCCLKSPWECSFVMALRALVLPSLSLPQWVHFPVGSTEVSFRMGGEVELFLCLCWLVWFNGCLFRTWSTEQDVKKYEDKENPCNRLAWDQRLNSVQTPTVCHAPYSICHYWTNIFNKVIQT